MLPSAAPLLCLAVLVARAGQHSCRGAAPAANAGCYGWQRRALAARPGPRGDEAGEWVRLGLCVLKQRASRRATMLMHVSKSGGTSVCSLASRQPHCRDVATAERHPDNRTCTARTCRRHHRAALARPGGPVGSNCWSAHMDDGPRWFEAALFPNQSAVAAGADTTAAGAAGMLQRLRQKAARGFHKRLGRAPTGAELDARVEKLRGFVERQSAGAAAGGVGERRALHAWMFDGPGKHTPRGTCQGRAAWLDALGANFFAVENYLPGFVCYRDFHSVIFIRDPLDRILSHVRHIVRIVEEDRAQGLPEAPGFLAGNIYRTTGNGTGTGSRDATHGHGHALNARFLGPELRHIMDNMCVPSAGAARCSMCHG